jgi:hypothetical protein
MKRTAIITISLGLLMLIVLSGCGSSGYNGRSHGSRGGLEGDSGTDVYTHDLPENARELTLELQLRASQGSYTWLVTDPEGNIAWEGSTEPGDSTEQKIEFDLLPGTWRLDLTTDNVSGSYDIEWLSR